VARFRPNRGTTLFLLAVIGPLPTVNSAVAPAPPSIVVINTDDQRFDSLGSCLPSYGAPDGPDTVPCMANVRALLQEQGVTFTQSFVSTAQCCPSRASLLTGLYAHTTGVLTSTRPYGGVERFAPYERANIAVWLHRAGYRTALIGKYLNGYHGAVVPPGWDDWHAHVGSSNLSYWHYRLNDDGVVNEYRRTYQTSVLGEDAVDFVASTPADQPLFLYFAPRAPHHPWEPNRGDGRAYEAMAPFRPPSFDEADVSDKPAYWRSLPVSDQDRVARADRAEQRQLATLLEIDRQVGRIVEALGPRLADTLIVFTSDNGLSWGEHRYFNKKDCEFEECHRVPMVVRYDPLTGGAARTDATHPVMNVDLAPTLAEVAGLTNQRAMGGRSLLPLLARESAGWRTAVLGEDYGSLGGGHTGDPPTARFVRTFPRDPLGPFKYVRVCSPDDTTILCPAVERELYDEAQDPYELCNLLSRTCGADPPPGVVYRLARRLRIMNHRAAPTLSVTVNSTIGERRVSFFAKGATRFRCSFDAGAFAGCSSPYTPSGQSAGSHTLTVIAEGHAGTSAPATVAWRVA
jgi:arylsulfatase A-like enzyme